MNEDLPGDKFEIDFPVWTVIDRNRYPANGLIPSIVPLSSPDVGRFLVLCTDADIARQFIKSFLPAPGIVPVQLWKLKTLHETLEALRKAEWTHVGIDVSLAGGKILGRFYPIGDVIEALSS